MEVLEKENEKQRYGRNKETIVNKKVLEGGEFRKKFDLITDNTELNKKLYQLAKHMLLHRSGTKYEDMYWLDPSTCEVVAWETQMDTEEEIVYSKRTKDIIRNKDNLITIHTHPMGLPPSIVDFNSNYTRGYSLGVVVGHNCKVYIYSSNEILNELYFKMVVADYIELGYNEDEAEIKAIHHCTERFAISFKEVTLDVE